MGKSMQEDLRATQERQARLRSEVRYLNDLQRELKLRTESTLDLVAAALTALDRGDAMHARALLEQILEPTPQELEQV
jgi:hypothetical protein